MQASFYYSDLATGGSSNKEYHIQIAKADGGWLVNFQHGPRGGTMQYKTRTKVPVSMEEAKAIFEDMYRERLKKGYRPEGEYACATPVAPITKNARTPYPPELLDEISDAEAERFIRSTDHWMQVKEDGHRRQIAKAGNTVTGFNKLGEAVPLPGELVSGILAKFRDVDFHIDGEQIGSRYVTWEILSLNGVDVSQEPYHKRYGRLFKMLPTRGLKLVSIISTYKTPQAKRIGFEQIRERGGEGVCFKPIEAPYRAGDNGQQKKAKFLKSASCIVSAVCVGGKASATLMMIGREGEPVCVGNVSTNGKGKIAVGDVVEITFLHTTAAMHLFQPRIKETRKDVKPIECTTGQLHGTYKEGVIGA